MIVSGFGVRRFIAAFFRPKESGDESPHSKLGRHGKKSHFLLVFAGGDRV
jgi:hypothetical protein